MKSVFYYRKCSCILSDCGERKYLAAGQSYTITSKDYGTAGYSSGTECSWLIETSQNTKLQLKFVDRFYIKCEWNTCSHWVEVITSADASIPGFRFCCARRPEVEIVSYSGQMIVSFKSPESTLYRNTGFKAVITAGTTLSSKV